MNTPEHRWQRLVEAARKAPPQEEPDQAVPSGILTRMHELREVVGAFARALLWRRWSVVLALCCLVLFLAVLALTRCGERRPPLIAPPESSPLQP